MFLDELGNSTPMDGDFVALEALRVVYVWLIGVCVVPYIAQVRIVESSAKDKVLLVVPHCKVIHSQRPGRPMIIVCKTTRIEYFYHG